MKNQPIHPPDSREKLAAIFRSWYFSACALALLVFTLQQIRVFDLADAYWLKSCFMVRKALGLESSHGSEIVIVPVTSSSIDKFGSWPWKRALWGQVTEKIEKSAPRVIGYDIDFSSVTPDDEIFSKPLQKNVVLPIWFEYPEKGKQSGTFSPIRMGVPSPVLETKTEQGFVNVQTGTLGVRRTMLLTSYQDKQYPAFALRAYLLAHGLSVNDVQVEKRSLKVGDLKVPLDGDGALWINFKTSNFQAIPADVVLDPKFNSDDFFKNKIVLIGVTSPIGEDLKITPAGALSGLEIQAQILRDLLDRDFIAPLPSYILLSLLLLVGLGIAASFPQRSWKRFLPWSFELVLLAAVIGLGAFAFWGTVIDIFAPILLIVILTSLIILAQTRRTEVVLESKIEEIKVLTEVSYLSTGNLTLDGLLSSAITMIEKVMEVDTLGILLKNEKKQWMLSASEGVSCINADRFLTPGEGLCGRAAETGQPVIVSDLSNSSETRCFEKTLEISSFMALPLISKGKAIGVVWIGDVRPDLFNEDSLARLSTVANQLAQSIDNCMMTDAIGKLYLDAIRALLRAVDYYQPSNPGHSERVASYAIMIAKTLQLPVEELETIRSAALLHDIVKMGHFETLYRKPDGLTEEDWKQIVTPLKSGLKILEPLSGQFPILPILYHLYERFDGKGFPDGLVGEKIPMAARILAVANAFDDISTSVPGQVAIARAIQELRKEAGSLFDPKIVRILISALSEVPTEELSHRSKTPA